MNTAPLNDPDDLLIGAKVSSETDQNVAQGGASLEGAEFTCEFYPNADGSGSPARTWVIRTDKDGYANLSDEYKVSGDDFYYTTGSDGSKFVTLPLGTLKVTETKAPNGYLLADPAPTFTQHIVEKDGKAVVEGMVEVSDHAVAGKISDQVMRSDASFVKCDDETQERLAHIPFMMTSTTTGESHVIMTDANGRWSSTQAPHSQNTNANDEAVVDGKVDESKLNEANGVWFWGAKEKTENQQVADDKGALPYDTYEIKELPCAANAGKQLVTFKLIVNANGQNYDLGTVTDKAMVMQTTATAEDGTKNVYLSNPTTIVDHVAYQGLTAGQEYTVKGVLMDKATNKPLLVDGKEVTAETTFTAEKSEGTVDVTFTFDGSKVEAGHETVVFEHMYQNDTEIMAHTDINDEGQTVTPKKPELHTTAAFADGQKTHEIGGQVTIIDKVEYEGLTAGKDYVVVGTLMTAEDQPVMENGKPVTVEKKFTADKSDGSVDVEFTLSSDQFKNGQNVVAFEKLYPVDDNGNKTEQPVATHEDINDKGQTVTFTDKPAQPQQVSSTTPASGSSTGSSSTPVTVMPQTAASILAGVLIGGGAIAAGVAYHMKKKNTDEE